MVSEIGDYEMVRWWVRDIDDDDNDDNYLSPIT